MLRTLADAPFKRNHQPVRFWLSFFYNLVVATLFGMIGVATVTAWITEARERPLREACLAARPTVAPNQLLQACDRWLTESRPAPFDVGRGRTVQAHAQERLGRRAEAVLLRRAAVAAYGRSLSGYPDDSGAYWNSALLMMQLGDLTQARDAWQAYVALEPDRGDGWLELGLTQLALGDLPAAVTSLNRAVERLPGEARPLAARGVVLALLLNRSGAAADIEAARRINPTDPLVRDAVRMLEQGRS